MCQLCVTTPQHTERTHHEERHTTKGKEDKETEQQKFYLISTTKILSPWASLPDRLAGTCARLFAGRTHLGPPAPEVVVAQSIGLNLLPERPREWEEINKGESGRHDDTHSHKE